MDLFFGEIRQLTAEEKAAREQFAARIRKDADPQILRRTERWTNHRMLPHRALPMAIGPQTTLFDNVLRDWHVGYLAANEMDEIPYELRKDLSERVPQALLRDIYRPVFRPRFVERESHEFQLDPGGRSALAEAKAALQREPIPTIQSSVAVVISEQRRRRRFVQRTWHPYRADDAPRFHTPQDGRFGEGWDDDDDVSDRDATASDDDDE